MGEERSSFEIYLAKGIFQKAFLTRKGLAGAKRNKRKRKKEEKRIAKLEVKDD